MRKTLNRSLINSGRVSPVVGSLLAADELRWEAYLQVHCQAEDMGILGTDEELHGLLDSRLKDYESRFQ